MEECFTFQWGVCFSEWGASFLSGGAPHGGIGFHGGGVKKNRRMGGTPHALPSLWETLYMKVHILNGYN